MNKVIVSVVLVLCAVLSGCASDDLDSLDLVSAKDLSVQKKQAPAPVQP